MKSLKLTLMQRAPKLLNASIKIAFGKDLASAVENLSELKGVPQKIGQLLSMDVSNYIPDEIKDKLRPLQGEGKALSQEQMLTILKSQLSPEKFNSVDDFDICLGAGSIGQVHRARVNQKNVVFKIQYPDIDKTIDSDLALFRPMASVYEFLRPQARDLSILLKEARLMLMTEIDYLQEANNLNFFKMALKNDERFIVPEVYSDHSNGKTICMEFVAGMPLGKFIKTASKEQKQQIGQSLLDLFIDEFFLYGKVQTDPNFANYLVNDEGKIVLLDFGAVKEFNPQFRIDYFHLLKAGYDQDPEVLLHWGEHFGLVDRRDKPEAVNLFISFMNNVLNVFHPEKNPVNFAGNEISKQLIETGWQLWKEQRISSPRADLVFLHRKVGGLFSLLNEMGVILDLHLLWQSLNKKASHLQTSL